MDRAIATTPASVLRPLLGRLLLVVGGLLLLWLLGSLFSSPSARADAPRHAEPTVHVNRLADVDVDADADVDRVVDRVLDRVAPALPPAVHRVATPVVNPVVHRVVDRVVTPVVHRAAHQVVPVVQAVVQPVVDRVVTPVVHQVMPAVRHVLAPLARVPVATEVRTVSPAAPVPSTGRTPRMAVPSHAAAMSVTRTEATVSPGSAPEFAPAATVRDHRFGTAPGAEPGGGVPHRTPAPPAPAGGGASPPSTNRTAGHDEAGIALATPGARLAPPAPAVTVQRRQSPRATFVDRPGFSPD